MKKTGIICMLLTVSLTMTAMPAKRGVWQTMKTADGREVRVQLCGDEHQRYMQAEDGTNYVVRNERLELADMDKLARRARERRAAIARKQAHKLSRQRKLGGSTAEYKGTKRALVILVEFDGKQFAEGNDRQKFHDILNQKGYTTNEGFKGSAHDYFWDQSGHQFNLVFDVVGPYPLANKYSYYGKNDSNGDDANMQTFIEEAIGKARADVKNSRDYDWDGDGYADLVFFLYAGYGEADYYDSKTIWPHMYNYNEYITDYWGNLTKEELKLGDVKIDTYACSNEVQGSGRICGIGTFCHEFSHCLGFPDFYDVQYGKIIGTTEYDLMCSGGYNGNGYCPPSYTSYERWVAGWQAPIELNANRGVEAIQPFSEHGNSYIIYNQAHPDEYYLLENRQKTGWDASLPGKGLLVYHVDYDANVWEDNIPNSIVNSSYYGTVTNDHERMAIVKANNSSTESTNANYPYPYGTNHSLSNTTTPAAKLYHANTDGSKLLNVEITDITQNSDKTISFNFSNGIEPEGRIEPVDAPPVFDEVDEEDPGQVEPVEPDVPEPEVPLLEKATFKKVTSADDIVEGGVYTLFNESDAMALGTYGSHVFKGVPATLEDSELNGEQIAVFTLGGDAGSYTLLLSNGLYLTTSAADKLSESEAPAAIWNIVKTFKGYVLSSLEWGAIKYCSIYGDDAYFVNSLDSWQPAVLYRQFEKTEPEPGPVTAISEVQSVSSAPMRIYTLDGRYVGTDFHSLGKGVYVIGRRKVVK